MTATESIASFRFDVTSLYRCLLLTPQFKLFRLQQSLCAHPNYQKCLSLGFFCVCVSLLPSDYVNFLYCIFVLLFSSTLNVDLHSHEAKPHYVSTGGGFAPFDLNDHSTLFTCLRDVCKFRH